MSLHWNVAFICFTVAIDNGLLMGILMPDAPKNIKRDATLLVGPPFAVIQFGLVLVAQKLLASTIVQLSAIALLTWITIHTILDMSSYRHSTGRVHVFLQVLTYTTVANVDDVLYLGAKVGNLTDPFLWWSLTCVPITVVSALFLAEQSQRHRWILLLGAALTAWSTSEIFIKTTVGIATSRMISQTDSPWATQFLFTAVLLLIGLSVSRVRFDRINHHGQRRPPSREL